MKIYLPKKIRIFSFLVIILINAPDISAAKIPLLNWNIPMPDLQASAWATWHNKMIPVPTRTDATSKVRIGGTGGGLDLTVRFFFPVYYGVLYEYMPVYSDTSTPTVSGYGTVTASAALYAHYFAGSVYLPLGDWIWELFLENYAGRLGKVWESILRSPYGKTSYGVHYMYASLAAGSDSGSTIAWRVGFTVESGLMFIIIENIRAYLAFDYHSIYEDSYYLLGFKGGLVYRHRFGTQ